LHYIAPLAPFLPFSSRNVDALTVFFFPTAHSSEPGKTSDRSQLLDLPFSILPFSPLTASFGNFSVADGITAADLATSKKAPPIPFVPPARVVLPPHAVTRVLFFLEFDA